jgi:hypothetical protein
MICNQCYGRNPDEEQRRLERRALSGDRSAFERYINSRIRIGHAMDDILQLVRDKNIEEAFQYLARLPDKSYDDIAQKVGIIIAKETGIWHGFLILTEEYLTFAADSLKWGIWGKPEDYFQEEYREIDMADWNQSSEETRNKMIQNIRERIDLTQYLYSFSNDVYTELNIGTPIFNIVEDGDEVMWDIEGSVGDDYNLVGDHILMDEEEDGELPNDVNQIILHIRSKEELLSL